MPVVPDLKAINLIGVSRVREKEVREGVATSSVDLLHSSR